LAPPEPARPAPAPPPEPVKPAAPARSVEPAKPAETAAPPPPVPAPAPAADGGAFGQGGEKLAAVAAELGTAQPAADSLAHAPDDPGAAKRHEDHDADAEPPKPAKQEGWWRTLFG
jgi:5'-nucleotidase/UDP-sugar diphosphatase